MKIKVYSQRGFILLETLLAMGIFSIVVTSIVFAIHSTAELQSTIQRETWVQQQMKRALTEALKYPQTKAEFISQKTISYDELGSQAIVSIEPSEIINDKTNTALKNHYKVIIQLFWYENDIKQVKTLETYHYFPLYQY